MNNTSNFPDFSKHSLGYKITSELGRNSEGGRITYRATVINSGQDVVLKKYCFARVSGRWSGFQDYEPQIQAMKQLSHPRIPRYLDCFEIPSGFCLVQEYKNFPSLAKRSGFSAAEIHQIAESVLEVLVELQKRTPFVIHRDIKPENILVDDRHNAYLVEFGFPRIKKSTLSGRAIVSGTPGFIPPEEIFDRALTPASDLYSLGATLICSLSGTSSENIGDLIDDNYRVNFQGKVPPLNPAFSTWLEKMVAFNVKERYANAEVALKELKAGTIPTSLTSPSPLKPTNVNALRADLIKRLVLLGLIFFSVVVLPGVGITFKILSDRQQIGQLLKQLQTTRKCPKCNLGNANLKGIFQNISGKVNASLEGANVEGANLEKEHLAKANLKHANLKNANLRNANLEGANLEGANLEGANLEGANLEGANLVSANLMNAKLEGARLKNAEIDETTKIDEKWRRVWEIVDKGAEGQELNNQDMKGANLEGANLEGANLNNANLNNANLNNANLRNANLNNANLNNANLKNADLENTNLEEAKLRSANLEDAKLSRAKLLGARFWGANLKGANLYRTKGANLENAQLKDTIMHNGTKHQ